MKHDFNSSTSLYAALCNNEYNGPRTCYVRETWGPWFCQIGHALLPCLMEESQTRGASMTHQQTNHAGHCAFGSTELTTRCQCIKNLRLASRAIVFNLNAGCKEQWNAWEFVHIRESWQLHVRQHSSDVESWWTTYVCVCEPSVKM